MDKIKDKIAKLLNMTVANGCSEDEQEVALKMASSLAAKNGIELEAMRPKDAPKIKATGKFRNEALKPHQAYCARAAAVLYGVECNSYNLGAGGVFFVGREDLIELTEQTMFWLFAQVERLYKEMLPRGMTQQRRAEFRKTFKAACAQRTYERAIHHMSDLRTNEATAQQAVGQNALVVRGYFETLSSEVLEYWNERHRKAEESRKTYQLRVDAYKQTLSPDQLKQYERDEKRRERNASKRVGRRGRSMPVGIGSEAGRAAGDRVQLRKEL